MCPLFPQIVLLIAFMCITLLVASLVCLTLPGEMWYFSYTQTHHLKSTVLFTGKHRVAVVNFVSSLFCFVCLFFYSIHWPLADVFLDRKFQNPRAVHSSMWSVCLLAFYPRGHYSAGVDATGTHCYCTQSPGVDTHGEHQWADWVVGKLRSWAAEGYANWLLPFQLWHCVFVKWM